MMYEQQQEEFAHQDLSADIAELIKGNEEIRKMNQEISIQIQEILSELDYLNRDRFDNMRDEYWVK